MEVFQVSRLMVRLSLLSRVAGPHRASREFGVSRMSCWGSLSSVARVAKVSSVMHGECIKYGAGQFRELHSASTSNVERSGRLLSVACGDFR